MILSDLLEAGANVDSQDADGYTALMLACLSDSVETTKLLLEYEADIEIENRKGLYVSCR